MTDLDESDRNALMKAVFIVESAIKIYYKPDKINLATLGNITPHLHWHIIPRYKHDNHFPESIWSNSKRTKKKELSESEILTLITLVQKRLSN